jgi:hypothetical protein
MIGSMRIVAFHTISLDDNAVDAFSLSWQESFVALETDFLRIFGKEFSVRRGMRVVAFGALPIFDRRVDKLTLEFLLKGFMAVQAEFSPCVGLQPEIILAVNERDCHDQAE